ncbi:MAG: glyoxalase [Erythrobacter sp.]|nr:glyoxalase [Erythrobacter sp.]
MPKGQLEHVNITVTDPERSAKLFENLCSWHERWRGPSQLGGWTIHVGDETAYLAIYTNERAKAGYAKGVPLNHVGVLVDDLDAAEQVVIAHGLEPFNHADYEPGRRFYFFDWDGIEFEVVSYADNAQ